MDKNVFQILIFILFQFLYKLYCPSNFLFFILFDQKYD